MRNPIEILKGELRAYRSETVSAGDAPPRFGKRLDRAVTAVLAPFIYYDDRRRGYSPEEIRARNSRARDDLRVTFAGN